MIAARLAGGNLFFAFFGWRIFLVEDFFGGGFWEHSEQLGAARSTRIFFEGICGGGILFFGGWWGVFWIVSVGKN